MQRRNPRRIPASELQQIPLHTENPSYGDSPPHSVGWLVPLRGCGAAGLEADGGGAYPTRYATQRIPKQRRENNGILPSTPASLFLASLVSSVFVCGAFRSGQLQRDPPS